MRVSGAYTLLTFCVLCLDCNALNCKTDRDPKGKELKNIYNNCMKQQDGNNNNNDRRNSDSDWRETQGYDRRSQDNRARSRGNDNRDYRSGEWDNRSGGNRKENRDRDDQNVMLGQNRNNRDDRMGYRDRNSNDRYNTRQGNDDRQNRNDNKNSERNSGVSSRNDFFQNEDFGEYDSNRYTTQSSRRYKRERRVEMNSGKRSQYNPNPQSRFSGFEERYEGEDKSSNGNNSSNEDDSKACALHCLLENLHMTGENGMPDRYLVTHVISKDVRDEDLKDFLQESIEECFQILDNENTDDKCEFSKNLLMCLSEKGRSNCDDWKDDFQF